MTNEDYQEINARVISSWVDDGWEWGQPIDHETYLRACAGEWQILLTPTVPVPRAWLPTSKVRACWGSPVAVASRCRC